MYIKMASFNDYIDLYDSLISEITQDTLNTEYYLSDFADILQKEYDKKADMLYQSFKGELTYRHIYGILNTRDGLLAFSDKLNIEPSKLDPTIESIYLDSITYDENSLKVKCMLFLSDEESYCDDHYIQLIVKDRLIF